MMQKSGALLRSFAFAVVAIAPLLANKFVML
jgi:hypothetical protein